MEIDTFGFRKNVNILFGKRIKRTMENLNLEMAKESYNNVVSLLNNIGDLIKPIDSYYSNEIGIRQFDLILQVIMLNQIISDRKLLKDEIEFLKAIPSKGDLVDFYNSNAKEDFTFKHTTWDILSEFTPKSFHLFLEDLNSLLEPIEDEFTFFLALIDVKTKNNEFDQFIKNITNILSCLNYVDGNASAIENVTAVTNLMKHFVRRYQYYLVSFEKGLDVCQK